MYSAPNPITVKGGSMLVDLSVTEMREIRKLLVHDQVDGVVRFQINHSMTQAEKESLMEKLILAIEEWAYELH
jgi:hypothetical protein